MNDRVIANEPGSGESLLVGASLPQRRRRLSFSLRVLFVVFALIALPLAWLGPQVRYFWRQREQIDAFTALGGKVEFQKEPAFPRWLCRLCGDKDGSTFVFVKGAYIGPDNNRLGDEMLAQLAQWKNIEEIGIPDSQITDDGVSHLSNCSQLKRLILSRSRLLTDRAMSHISRIESLQHLNICATSISDKGLACLASLPMLQWLDCSHLEASGRGLAGCAHLRGLRCVGVPITDDAFIALCNHGSLDELEIDSNVLTDGGLANIAALPIRKLTLRSPKVSDKGLSYIAACDALVTVDLRSMPVITDQGLEALSTISTLTTLSVHGISRSKNLSLLESEFRKRGVRCRIIYARGETRPTRKGPSNDD